MAFDKAVDSAVLDANLKTVADAIREKAGTSDSLVFPTGFAEAIAGIQAGGGSGGGGIASGYFIPSADLGSDCDLTITHNLGEIPKCAICFRDFATDAYNSETFVAGEVAFSLAINGTMAAAGYYYSSNRATTLAVKPSVALNLAGSNTGQLNGSCVYACTTETAKLFPIKNANKTFVAGNKYRWILMTEEAYNAL